MATELPITDNNVCRLCQAPCGGNRKCINEDNAQMDEVYRITVKYFPAKFLEPSWSSPPAALCLECWRHIIEFYSFQETIFEIKNKLLGRSHEVGIDMDVVKDAASADAVTPAPDMNRQNVENKSAYVNNSDEFRNGCELTFNEEEDPIDISLSDLEDIDIQFSSDDEISVSNGLDDRVKLDIETPLQNPTSKSNTSQDSQALEGTEIESSDPANVVEDIDQYISKYKPKFECWICSKSVATFELLQDHFRLNHTGGQCYITCCQMKLNSKTKIEEHIRLKHTQKEGFMCDECKIEYPSASILENHQIERHSKIVQHFNCPECPQILSTREQLAIHYNAHFVCQECNKVFTTTGGLKCHTRMVHATTKKPAAPAISLEDITQSKSEDEKSRFEFFAARKQIEIKSDLQNLKRARSNSSASQDTQASDSNAKKFKGDTSADEDISKYMPKFECWICQKSRANFELLEEHFRLNHRIDQCYITCCQSKLSSGQLVKEHMRLKHTPKKDFKCEVCNITHYNAFKLKKHQIQMHPEIVKDVMCPKCSKILPTREHLEKHYEVHFQQCQECNKLFETKGALKSHMHTVHVVSKNKGTPVASLNAFKCEKCGKTLASKIIFENHQFYAHRKDCKFKCDVCEKAFKKAIHFRDHMNYHSTDNYYTCPHCPTKFQYWFHLDLHMQLNHLEKCTKRHMKQILLAEEAYAALIRTNKNKTNGKSETNAAAEKL